MPSDNKKVIPAVRHRAVKRLTDVLISLFGMIVLSPLMLYVALRVRFSSKGPVIYSQERMGYKGKIFRIRKFRSMHDNAESFGPQLSETNDRRITPWGRTMRRWKLDELPQFWNVLAGEMSIVGPRPERAYYIEQIGRMTGLYPKLLELKPGITSLGMVRFGYAGNVDEMIQRMQYDLFYLGNNSLKMDIRIMISTLRIILKEKGR